MDEFDRLFDACRNGNIEYIKLVATTNVDLIRKKDLHNNTAMHVACENDLSIEGINCLYSSFPEALSLHNDEGALPIHMACVNGKSVENLKFLMSKLPMGFPLAIKNGDLLIHLISENSSEKFVKFLLEQLPKCVETKNKQERLPIHIACKKGSSLNVIRALHEAYPVGILQPDEDGTLALHDACKRIPRLDVIKFFVEVCPSSFDKADNRGNLPLHYAVRSKCAEAKNKQEKLPMHVGCKKLSSLNVIRELYEAYPAGMLQPDEDGTLAVHDACKGIPRLDLIKFFVEVCPSSFEKADNGGNLPLHYAVRSSPVVVIFVIDANKNALKTPNKEDYLPIHQACSFSAEDSIIKLLHESYTDGITMPDKKGRLPIHIACDKGSLKTALFIFL